MNEDVLPVYRMIQGRWALLDGLPTLEVSKSVAVLGLFAVFMNAYNIRVQCSRWSLTNMNCMLLHVKFEVVLSILTLGNEIILNKILGFKTDEF